MIEISEANRWGTQSTLYSNQTQIEKISCHDLSFEMFYNNFMRPNIPVVIQSVDHNWPSTLKWIKSNSTSIDLSYLKYRIPNHRVPTADCSKQHLNAHEKFEMNFHDFLDYWNSQMTKEFCDDKLWYLKDWHLRKNLPSYSFYKTPKYFGSDWLNECLSNTDQDDYMFVYMGPKGTWTPLHSDVFSSYSWSTNIFGTKQWLLICPEEEKKLLDNYNNFPFSVTEERLQQQNCKYFRVIQNAGETLFVPTGWYHQVHNLDHTISINHNFFNGCNVLSVWSALFESYQKVLKEIDDCKDMDNFEEHCQIMLKALHGMNFESFLELLDVVVNNRIKCFRSGNQLSIFNFVLGRNLCIFDLNSCLVVLGKIEENLQSLNIFSVKVKDVCYRLKIIINDELKNQLV